MREEDRVWVSAILTSKTYSELTEIAMDLGVTTSDVASMMLTRLIPFLRDLADDFNEVDPE